MNFESLKIQSLIWPVLFFIGGISMVYASTSYINIGLQILLVVVFFSSLVNLKSKYCTPYLGWIVASLLLFYGSGILLSKFHQREFVRSADLLDTTSSSVGTVFSVQHYENMDRLQIRVQNNHWWKPPHYYNINLLDKNHSIHKGQVIALNRPLKPIESSNIPYAFDAKKYWHLQNTSHELFLYRSTDLIIIRDVPQSFFFRLRQTTAEKIDHLYQNSSQAAILKALLLGQKENVSSKTKEVFKRAGLMHILAVSGLHVGIVSVLLFILLLPVKLLLPRSPFHYLFVLMTLWAYAALTGMNTPVVRAVILTTFYLTARRINRQVNPWNVYFWAVLLVLVIHPNAFFTVSFQLSFGAVASILLFFKTFKMWVRPFFGDNYFTGLVAVSLSAQAGIIPLLLIHFQEISLLSTLSSFLIIPLLFPLIFISALSIILPASWNWFTDALVFFSSQILKLIMDLSEVLAAWSFSSVLLVWNDLTIALIVVILLLIGLSLELRELERWVKYATFVLVVLAASNEAFNIYQKRSSPVLVRHPYKYEPVSEIYFQGICYTSFIDNVPPHLVRMRHKYYVKKKVLMSGVKDWDALYGTLWRMHQSAKYPQSAHLLVLDYIEDHTFAIDLSISSKSYSHWPFGEQLPAPEPQN